MNALQYLDFDLLIEPVGEGYLARVTTSPDGQANHGFSLPFCEEELEVFSLRVIGSQSRRRGIESPSMEEAQKFGASLFSAVFGGQVKDRLYGSLKEAEHQGKGLRLRIHLNDTPELINLPWEYLYNPTRSAFFSLSNKTPIVRYLDLPESAKPLSVMLPLNVLVMVASPEGLPELDVELEWRNLCESLDDLIRRGLVSLDRLKQATPKALRQQLRRSEYHIFHFIGHGRFNSVARRGELLLEDSGRKMRPVSGQHMSRMLQNHSSLRLAILNACDGASSADDDAFSGTAQSLVQQAIPAVIAMQQEITDSAAVNFTHEFYAALADGYPVDTALAQARISIADDPNSLEWGTPVLYLRTADGHMFNLETPTAVRIQVDQLAQPAPRPLTSALEPPKGIVGTDSLFYVKRPSEEIGLEAIKRQGVTIIIKAPGQMGRTTFLMRLIDAAKELGKRVVYLDFLMFGKSILANETQFFKHFCSSVTYRLKMENKVDQWWKMDLSNTQLCTNYLQDYILAESANSRLVLALDEVDSIFDENFRSDFFSMLRNWHVERAIDKSWKKLDVVFVTSAELYELIDKEGSAFNVGLEVSLTDFEWEQVRDLNARHGSVMTEEELRELMELVGGHPHLVRSALYESHVGRLRVKDLIANAAADDGPFGKHLSNLCFRLFEREGLPEKLKEIIQTGVCADQRAFLRLASMGLVRRKGRGVLLRCQVYRDYFKEHLGC